MDKSGSKWRNHVVMEIQHKYNIFRAYVEIREYTHLERQSPADHQYWKEKLWFIINQKYFFDIPVNPLYHAIGMVIEWIAVKQIFKNLIQGSGEQS